MRGALLPALGLAVAACGEADHVCSANVIEIPPEGAVEVTSAELSGQVTLSAQSPVEHVAFQVRMTDLPRVWTPDDSTIGTPSLFVSTKVSYVSEQPEGAELPAVRLVLDNGVDTTGGAAIALFEVCDFDSDASDCCPFGAESCEARVELSLERDADIFPTVSVNYRVQARADVYDCTRSTPSASFTLEEGS